MIAMHDIEFGTNLGMNIKMVLVFGQV